MAQNKGEALLLRGQQLRETGKTLRAIDALNRAMQEFAKVQDYPRFAHAILDRGICWQHLYQLSGGELGFAVLYKKDAEAMLEIVQAKHVVAELADAYFMNAKTHVVFRSYAKAVEFFTKALKEISPKRRAQRGDWRTNLGKALYLSGEKKKGVAEILAGIRDVQKYRREVDSYTFNVWLSGGYIRLAEVLAEASPARAAEYLRKATEIVEADPSQVVRKVQLKNFMATGSSGL